MIDRDRTDECDHEDEPQVPPGAVQRDQRLPERAVIENVHEKR